MCLCIYRYRYPSAGYKHVCVRIRYMCIYINSTSGLVFHFRTRFTPRRSRICVYAYKNLSCMSVLRAHLLSRSDSILLVLPDPGAGTLLRLQYFSDEASPPVPQQAAPWRTASPAETVSSLQGIPRREPADTLAKPPGPSESPCTFGSPLHAETAQAQPASSPWALS